MNREMPQLMKQTVWQGQIYVDYGSPQVNLAVERPLSGAETELIVKVDENFSRRSVRVVW